MLCNIKPVPFHESDKHIFAKIPGGGSGPPVPTLDPPIHRYSALTYDVMKSYLTLLETRKFVMAILHWKQGLLSDKTKFCMFCPLSLRNEFVNRSDLAYKHIRTVLWQMGA